MFSIDVYLAIYLVLIGFIVGILSGFFGFGGGFIITPFLFTLGVPMNVAVGTSIAQIVGTSVIATMRHRTLKHVDLKLGMMTAVGSIMGMELGAQMVEFFKGIGAKTLDTSVSITYIVVLGFVSIFMFREALKSRRSANPCSKRVIADKVQGIRIPPMISLPQSNVDSVSFWVVLFVGFITSVLAGFIGAGGGFIQVPLLIYIIGCETIVAVGTNLFAMLIAGVYACFSHAIKGNVDIVLATIMLVGSSLGAWIGTSATRYVKGTNLRLIFGFCVGLTSLSIFFELMGRLSEMNILRFLSQVLLVLTLISVALLIMALAILGDRSRNKNI